MLLKGTVRTIDKAAVAGQRMKHAYIATKKRRNILSRQERLRQKNMLPTVLRQVRIPLYTKALTLWIKQVAKAFRPQRKISSRQKTAWNALSRSEPNSPYDGRHLKSVQRQTTTTTGRQAAQTGKSSIKTVEQTGKTVKQSATSAGKRRLRRLAEVLPELLKKTVKTAEQTAKSHD